ncbi:MAG: SpoIIE family protein phosphatase, partial [Ilumatobacter sp.]
RRMALDISLALHDGVIILGASGEVLWHNSVACRLMRRTSDELFAGGGKGGGRDAIRPDGTTFPVADDPAVRTLWDGFAVTDEVMGLRVGDSSLRWMRVNSTPIANFGKFYVLTTFTDITDEFENRRALDATLLEIEERLVQLDLPADNRIRFVGSYRSVGISNSVGGDFYGAYQHPSDRVSFFIGDVCGHRVRAAGLSSLARDAVRALAPVVSDPAAVIAHLHDLVKEERPDTFLTALFGTLYHDEVRTTMSLVSGGHPFPLLIRDGSVEQIGRAGHIVGMVANSPRPVTTFELRPGDQVVSYTDGLTDAMHPRLSDEELAERIPTNASLDDVVGVLRRMSESFRGDASDDAAVLAFEIL